MTELYVVGTRSFAGEVADLCDESGLQVLALLEPDDAGRAGATAHGLPVLPLEQARGALVAIATGEPDRRPVVARLESLDARFVRVVHPRAHVSPRSVVGDGAIVAPGVVVGAYTEIGAHAVLGRGVLVGHHTTLGSFVTLNPGANVAGNVTIEDDVFVGMAAVIRDHVTVGAAAVVAMGAVVVRDVEAGAQARGLPASVYEAVEPPDREAGEGPSTLARNA